MDGQKFDALVRSLAVSRRAALKGALAGAASLIGVTAGADAARRGYPGPNITGCTIGGVQYANGAVDPGQPCRYCDPLANKFGWTSRAEGSSCGNGQCCYGGVCEACGCVIGGVRYAAGAENPANTCQACHPEADAAAWSTKSNDDTCDPNGWTYCCEGVCCDGAGYCCRDRYCYPCFCVIDGVVREDLSLNPLNECQWCAASLSLTSWVNRTIGQPCGDGQICCAGACCPVGQTCLGNVCGPPN